jgi:uncharacterized membrane protein
LISPFQDTKTEVVIGNLLRTGVLLSATTVLAGGMLYLRQFGDSLPHHQVFQGEPSRLRSVSGILTLALQGDPRGIISLGILLLIATPILRVAFSVWAFARERDRLYVGITLVVLTLLLYSLFQI